MEFDWLLSIPVAHRGLHDDEFPENSMPAFEAAIKHGFNIEIDVHLTRDGALVVFHDDTLKRVCGVEGKVRDFTLEELKKLRLADSQYTIPAFDEFLSLVKGKTGILCEIKGLNPYDNSIAEAVCKRIADYDGNIALQSFNYGAVRYCRRHSDRPCGQLCTWQDWHGKDRAHVMDFMGKLWVNRLSRPHFTAYDIRSAADNKYLERVREKMPVLVWTVNSPEKLDLAAQVADNIIFEDIAPIVEERYADRLGAAAPSVSLI